MGKVSINELESMSTEDKLVRIRERVIEMYEEKGELKDALIYLWKDVEARQKQGGI